MRYETYSLDVVQSTTGAGTGFPCAHHFDKWVQLADIAGGGSVTIEGTIDGTHWIASTAGALTVNGVYEIPEGFASIRVNRTIQGTGNPTVALGARQGRSE